MTIDITIPEYAIIINNLHDELRKTRFDIKSTKQLIDEYEVKGWITQLEAQKVMLNMLIGEEDRIEKLIEKLENH